VKNWVAARNTTFKIADVQDLARQKFDSVTSETWSSVCEHVDNFFFFLNFIATATEGHTAILH
jgi:hypothetical protein